jgi:hypothetical protein
MSFFQLPQYAYLLAVENLSLKCVILHPNSQWIGSSILSHNTLHTHVPYVSEEPSNTQNYYRTHLSSVVLKAKSYSEGGL